MKYLKRYLKKLHYSSKSYKKKISSFKTNSNEIRLNKNQIEIKKEKIRFAFNSCFILKKGKLFSIKCIKIKKIIKL